MASTTIGQTVREAVGQDRRRGRAGPRWIAIVLLAAFAAAWVAYKAYTRPDDAAGLQGHESSTTFDGFDPGASPGASPDPAPAAPTSTRGP